MFMIPSRLFLTPQAVVRLSEPPTPLTAPASKLWLRGAIRGRLGLGFRGLGFRDLRGGGV